MIEKFNHPTVDGRNPTSVDMVNITIICRVLYVSGGAGFLPSTVSKDGCRIAV